MTHAKLAKALNLSRPQVSRDVAKGMPTNVRGAKQWREDNKLFQVNKSGPKKLYDESEEPEDDELQLVLEIASELPGLAKNDNERKVLARAEKYVTEEVRILINTR